MNRRLKSRLGSRPANTSAAGSAPVTGTGYETGLGTGILLYRDGLLTGHLLPSKTQAVYMDDINARSIPDKRVLALKRKLIDYFLGKRVEFKDKDLPIYWGMWSGFEQSVARALLGVGYGRTASYSDLAAAAGYPRAYRAVGNFMAKNPFPLLFPCHRVIKINRQAGGYSSGGGWKRRLLELEGIHL